MNHNDLSEFEASGSGSSGSNRDQQQQQGISLPSYESRVPEPVNNYNLPSDAKIIEEKLSLLKKDFPTFANKSADDLEDLLRFEDLFQAHIDGLEQVQTTRTFEYELREGNERLAEQNLRSEPELVKLRENVAELQTFANSLTSRVFELMQEQADSQVPFSPQVLLQKLRDECKELDGESEKLAGDFMEGDMEAEDFVRRYKELRTRYHSSDARYRLADKALQEGSLIGVPMSLE